ncbi:cytochrome c oxidase subunit 4 [Rhodococcus sp. X156]|uniref:cytochrome c oxidase subunit 4 n=1 Tax=Rhodococcus sp. X156 TaxID=2499145 RepID=UPI000FDB75FA|nr:cytochrome c oxidase subunit 4 [Rhodococcus sp. X156]
MRIEARIFELLTAFFLIVAVIYGVLSQEPIGTTALALSAGLSLIVGTYFRFVARRLALRPEDYGDAEISDGAGDLGFFSPGSYWPVVVAAAAGMMAISLAFYHVWMIVLAGVVVILTAAGMVFEYHMGPEKH